MVCAAFPCAATSLFLPAFAGRNGETALGAVCLVEGHCRGRCGRQHPVSGVGGVRPPASLVTARGVRGPEFRSTVAGSPRSGALQGLRGAGWAERPSRASPLRALHLGPGLGLQGLPPPCSGRPTGSPGLRAFAVSRKRARWLRQVFLCRLGGSPGSGMVKGLLTPALRWEAGRRICGPELTHCTRDRQLVTDVPPHGRLPAQCCLGGD